MSNFSTEQPFSTSLPPATKHQVEHMFDCPLTHQEYADHLAVSHEQIRRLKSLFSAIQADGNVEPGFIASDLALMGEHLAGLWIRELCQRQKEFDGVMAR